MQEVIKPNTVKRIHGYGLPFPKDSTRKGDLLVAFDIQFPEKLSTTQKEAMRDMLWCVLDGRRKVCIRKNFDQSIIELPTNNVQSLRLRWLGAPEHCNPTITD